MSARLIAVLAAILVAVTTGVLAQQTLPSHTLLGTVTDAGGAALPGVTVELTNPASSDSLRTVVTDANGRYRIERVVPGLYVLTFRLPGFAPVIRDLDIGTGDEAFEFDVEMRVGANQPLTMATPVGPRRRVVCGLTIITPPNVDPKMVIPDRQPPASQNAPPPTVKPMIRAIQPTMCWDSAPLAPSVPAR